jgi:hypothetical protein
MGEFLACKNSKTLKIIEAGMELVETTGWGQDGREVTPGNALQAFKLGDAFHSGSLDWAWDRRVTLMNELWYKQYANVV